jgi:thiol-disulfide isomerase/thioredoxin
MDEGMRQHKSSTPVNWRTRLVILVAGLVLLALARVETPTYASPHLQSTPVSPTPRAVVRVILFWSQYCPHCHDVIENVLPPLQKKYGAQLEIYMFELSHPDNRRLFENAMQMLNVPPSHWGVPFMIVGTQTLVGSLQVSQQLDALIAYHLARGGIGLLPLPELEQRVATPTSPALAPTLAPRAAAPTVNIVVNATPSAATPVPTAIVSVPKPIVRAALFWMQGCPRCEEILARVLPPLQNKYGEQLDLRLIEIVTQEDVERLYHIAANFNIPKEQTGVPFVVIGQYALTAQQIPTELPHLIEQYLAAGGVDLPDLNAVARPARERYLLDVPLVGVMDLEQHSLAFSTLLIGMVDGFNPCSLWVISLLLALVVNTGSRTKTVLVGLTFLLVAASIYALILMGLFSVFTFIGYAVWIRIAVALLAGTMALINIKDYFWFKRGVSLTIADEHKPMIYRGVRSILAPNRSALALVTTTAALALGVTLIEMPCTAGLPILWTKLVTAHQVSTTTFVFLLGLYMLMYILDEGVVFLSAVATLRATRLDETQGRMLKLIGGVVMLTLAGVLLVNPLLMENLTNAMLVFGSALLIALTIAVVHRKILPRFGIVIGTDTL